MSLLLVLVGVVWIMLGLKQIHGSGKQCVNRGFFDEFECGFMAVHPSNPSMVFSYIVIGVFFVVFDLEIALLLNIPYQEEMYFGFYWFVGFLVVLCVGYAFEVHNGYVRWSK